jgi:flagella basal body P-ring formation protein FlgA
LIFNSFVPFLFALVIAAVSSTAFADGEASIQVKPVVEVDGTNSEITFGDLIVVHGINENLIQDLRETKLADTPKAGESRSFTALALEEPLRPLLRRLEDRTGERVTLRVPPRITVTRKIFKITNEMIEAELKVQLKAVCEECRFDITNVRMPIVAGASQGVSWSLKMRPELPKGSFSIPLEVKNADGSRRTFWVAGQVTVMKNVPVLARAVEIGEKLRNEDFVKEMKDVTYATDVAPTATDLETSVTARSMAAGQILWRNALKREVAVKNGDIVKVVTGGESESATWQISIDGVSQVQGYIGDMVKVKITKTQKLVSGILKEKGLVEVR